LFLTNKAWELLKHGRLNYSANQPGFCTTVMLLGKHPEVHYTLQYLHYLMALDYLLSGNKKEANFHSFQTSVVKQKNAELELVGLHPSFQIYGIY